MNNSTTNKDGKRRFVYRQDEGRKGMKQCRKEVGRGTKRKGKPTGKKQDIQGQQNRKWYISLKFQTFESCDFYQLCLFVYK